MIEENNEPEKCGRFDCPIYHFGYCTCEEWVKDYVCVKNKE